MEWRGAPAGLPSGRPSRYDQAMQADWPRADWEEGARAFSEGRFWAAHEAWERGWRELPPAARAHVQGLILAAGAFHHLLAGRGGPAQALVARARELFAERNRQEAAGGKRDHGGCRLEAPGLEEALAELARRWGPRGSGPEPDAAAEWARVAGAELRARVEESACRT
jgi:hypothetical protein